MPPDQLPQPPRRADAERNRVKILEAARTAFADPRSEVSMAEISRSAGVGMATLYRNFPGRRELLEALYVDEVDVVCEAAESLRADASGERFVAWIHHFFSFYNSKRHVGDELLKDSKDNRPLFGGSRARVMAAGRPLLVAAQQAKEIRGDLTLEQILDMVIAIARIQGEPVYLEPILKTALDGLNDPRDRGE
jgi:AcrR family transcriptional regulator